MKPIVVTTHLNRLVETVQMRGNNICFYAELTKIILIITKYFHLKLWTYANSADPVQMLQKMMSDQKHNCAKLF